MAIEGDKNLVGVINTNAGGLDRGRILRPSDVAKQNGLSRAESDRQSVEILNAIDHGVVIQKKLVCTEVGRAGGDHEVSLFESTDDIHRHEISGHHALGVEVDHDRAVAPPDDNGGDATIHGTKHVANLDTGDVLLPRIVEEGIGDG